MPNASQLTCEEFQIQIVELVGSASEFADIERLPHAKACAIYRELLQDIETITEAARYNRFGTDDWPEST